jgi:DNA-binding LacI/PurR family transcriptional regulator
VIIPGICLAAQDHPQYLGNEFRDFPIVVVDSYDPCIKRAHVVADNFQAGREMTQYLISRKHDRIAFIKFVDDIWTPTVADRIEGYKLALMEAGKSVPTEYLASFDPREELGVTALDSIIEKLMAVNPPPDAIIVVNDAFVPNVIRCLRNSGFKVPEDIIVAGFDNVYHQHVYETWPTTSPDFVRMGERAAEMLLDQIKKNEIDASGLILPCPLLIPESISGSEKKINSRIRLRQIQSVIGCHTFRNSKKSEQAVHC